MFESKPLARFGKLADDSPTVIRRRQEFWLLTIADLIRGLTLPQRSVR